MLILLHTKVAMCWMPSMTLFPNYLADGTPVPRTICSRVSHKAIVPRILLEAGNLGNTTVSEMGKNSTKRGAILP